MLTTCFFSVLHWLVAKRKCNMMKSAIAMCLTKGDKDMIPAE